MAECAEKEKGRGLSQVTYTSTIVDVAEADATIVDLLDRWRGRALGGPAADGPRWMDRRALDPGWFREYLGRISVIDVLCEPLDFRFRLDGSDIAEETAQDLTGRLVREAQPVVYGDGLYEDFAACVERAAPTVFHVELAHGPMTMRYFRIVLPLAVGTDDSCTVPRALLSYAPRGCDSAVAFPWRASLTR